MHLVRFYKSYMISTWMLCPSNEERYLRLNTTRFIERLYWNSTLLHIPLAGMCRSSFRSIWFPRNQISYCLQHLFSNALGGVQHLCEDLCGTKFLHCPNRLSLVLSDSTKPKWKYVTLIVRVFHTYFTDIRFWRVLQAIITFIRLATILALFCQSWNRPNLFPGSRYLVTFHSAT